jgi:hypothetical protein
MHAIRELQLEEAASTAFLIEKGQLPVTSDVPQAWFVMLQDEASAGRVVVPLKPFLRFTRRMEKQLRRLEKKILAENPQLARRGLASNRISGR